MIDDELDRYARRLRALAEAGDWSGLAAALHESDCVDCLRRVAAHLVGGELAVDAYDASHDGGLDADLVDDGEGIEGSAENDRALAVRSFAWRILAAQFRQDTEQNSAAALDAVAAGLRIGDINAALAELRHVYRLDDIAPADALNVISEELRLRQLDNLVGDGPGPDAEHHRKDEIGIPLHPFEPATGPGADEPDEGDALIGDDDPRSKK